MTPALSTAPRYSARIPRALSLLAGIGAAIFVVPLVPLVAVVALVALPVGVGLDVAEGVQDWLYRRRNRAWIRRSYGGGS